MQELVERALSAEPCAVPEPKKLAPPAPPPGEMPVTARELPNGKGWLRWQERAERRTQSAYATRYARARARKDHRSGVVTEALGAVGSVVVAAEGMAVVAVHGSD